MSERRYKVTIDMYISDEVSADGAGPHMPRGARHVASAVQEWLYGAMPDDLPDGAVTFHVEAEEVAALANTADEDPEACPTCGNKPGDGVGCDDPNGCGFGREAEEQEGSL